MKLIYILIFELLNLIDLRYRVRLFGNFLDKIRMFFLRKCGAKIGNKSRIGSNVFILNYKNLDIGNFSSIGKNSELFNYEIFKIGNNVDIGTQLYINTANHIFSDNKIPLSKQGAKNNPIILENDIWVGARVTILSGSYILERVVIGAGSIISKKLEKNKVYAGNPARIINEL